MKSSTLNPSINALKTDKRFEALIKNQMAEHQAIISSHNEEMQSLRTDLKFSMERFYSHFNKCSEDIRNLSLDANTHIGLLKERMIVHEKFIEDQKKTIQEFCEQLHQFHSNYISRNESEKIKNEMNSKLNESTKNHINSFQCYQQEVKSFIKELKEELAKIKHDMTVNFSLLDKQLSSKFSISQIDKEGVLKEVRVFAKTIFIIEKKIENLYSLIDRINKRGEACHKLA